MSGGRRHRFGAPAAYHLTVKAGMNGGSLADVIAAFAVRVTAGGLMAVSLATGAAAA